MKYRYGFKEQFEALAEADAKKRRVNTIFNTEGMPCDAMDYSPGEKERTKITVNGRSYSATYRAVRFDEDNFWEFVSAKKL